MFVIAFTMWYNAKKTKRAVEIHDFEYFCADLLKYDGFSHISVTKGSNDQGVDIIAYKDGQKCAIQCKRYNNTLGNKPVQEVNTGRAIYGCSRAIVLTNNYFTKGAIEASSATGVILWDRRKLDALIRAKQHSIGTKQLIRAKQQSAGLKKPVSFVTNGENNKKIIFWTVGGIVFFFILILLIVISVDESANEQLDSQDIETHQVEEYSTEMAEVHLETGESKVFNTISFTVTNIMFARHYGNLKYLDMVDSELINCCVYADLVNTGDTTADLKGCDAVLVCDGIEYKQTLMEDSEFLFSHQGIEPNKSLNGKVIDFQIPNALQYSDSQIYIIIISPDGQRAMWQLR